VHYGFFGIIDGLSLSEIILFTCFLLSVILSPSQTDFSLEPALGWPFSSYCFVHPIQHRAWFTGEGTQKILSVKCFRKKLPSYSL
jgi:hypothetical protein